MKYLVDANVLSEPTKPDPAERVVRWLRRNQTELAVDPVIVGEIRFGIDILPPGARRTRLEHWFESGVVKVRCLPFQMETGLRWARLLADLRATGTAMPIKDSLIAATALTHDLTVVTRNTRDFRNAGATVLDPFDES